jgi:chitodextrinase
LIDGRPVRGDGITYIVTGAGGNLFTRFAAPVPAYSAFREDNSYEFVKVTVGPTELIAQALTDEGRTVIDRTTIKRRKSDTTPPTGPTGVVAARPTLRAVYLNWKASTDDVGVTGYQILRDGDPKPIATVSAPGFTQTTLDPSTTYRYTVRAVDAAGNLSAASPVAVASPPDNAAFDLNGAQRSGGPQATSAGSNQGKTGCAGAGTPVPLPAGKQAGPSAFAFRRRPTRQPAPRRGPDGRTD